jgi:hypothetical protein
VLPWICLAAMAAPPILDAPPGAAYADLGPVQVDRADVTQWVSLARATGADGFFRSIQRTRYTLTPRRVPYRSGTRFISPNDPEPTQRAFQLEQFIQDPEAQLIAWAIAALIWGIDYRPHTYLAPTDIAVLSRGYRAFRWIDPRAPARPLVLDETVPLDLVVGLSRAPTLAAQWSELIAVQGTLPNGLYESLRAQLAQPAQPAPPVSPAARADGPPPEARSR